MPKIIADPTNKIIAASLDVLKKVGEEKFSMRLVAKKANISVGSIYNYYPDKESLLKAVEAKQGESLLKEIASYRVKGKELPVVLGELYDKAYQAINLEQSEEDVLSALGKALARLAKEEYGDDYPVLLAETMLLGIKKEKDKKATLLLAENALR